MSEQALVEIQENHEIAMSRPPALVLAEAKKAADALQEIIRGKKNPVKFNGEQYIEFEDWQVLGKFYGITVKVASTTPVEFGEVRGYEARAVALDTRTGIEISAADAMCLNDEDKWSSRTKYQWNDEKKIKEKVGDVAVPMFQLRSMAQTRACAKAFRNVLAWVVVLAGYKPTPAEEMTGAESSAPAPAPIVQPQRASTAAPTSNGHLDRTKMKAMTAKFAGKCAECGGAVAAGEMVLYDPDAKKVVHHAPCIVVVNE